MTALATILSGVGGIDKYNRPASIFSFALEALLEETPSGIQDALGKIAVNHTADRQILDGDELVASDQRANQLVQKVFTLIGNVCAELRKPTYSLAAVASP